jgi:hypothetical protein
MTRESTRVRINGAVFEGPHIVVPAGEIGLLAHESQPYSIVIVGGQNRLVATNLVEKLAPLDSDLMRPSHR